jgi:hypothetical protein
MFTTPTVFVLGAGVAAPFGFPVGRQMKDAICNGQYRTAGGFDVTTLPPSEMADVISRAMGDGYTPGIATEFLDAFRSADLYSVDAWLEANQADKHILKAGKSAIAAVILHAESVAKEKGADVRNDWHAWLWNNLWTPDLAEIENNQVWFITFNYDRLLEWKLARQVRNTYLRAQPAQHEKAINFLRSRIVHVHGALGYEANRDYWRNFGWAPIWSQNIIDRQQIEESKAIFSSRVQACASTIKIVSETPSDESLVENASNLIKTQIVEKAARIVFLGFSYDKRNVVKLNMDKHGSMGLSPTSDDRNTRVDESTIVGSAMGITRAERVIVEARFGRSIALGGPDTDAVAFCRSYLTPA